MRTERVDRSDGAAVAPNVSVACAAELERVAQRLAAARQRIAGREPREIAAALAQVAANWTRAGSPWMERAIDALAAAGPHSRPMLQRSLPRMIAPLLGGSLEDLVCRELGNWRAIECGRTPRLVLHVLPSNMPAHAAIPSALTLLLRSAALLKTGRDDRIFPPLWIDSIRAVDAELAECVAAVYWPGSQPVMLEVAASHADLVVASGSDAAISALRRQCTARFIGHGHRISFAVVCRDSQSMTTAASLADDVALCDQLGCLSPQVCFIEGDLPTAVAFAERVCAALATLAVSLPPAPMSSGEVLDVRRFRDAAAWRGFNRASRLAFEVSADPASGTVVVEDEPALKPTPLHRCLRVVPIPRLENVTEIVAPHRAVLEAAGIAIASEEAASVRRRLGEVGVSHIVPVGDMQRPTLAWWPGGRPRLAEWMGRGPTEAVEGP